VIALVLQAVAADQARLEADAAARAIYPTLRAKAKADLDLDLPEAYDANEPEVLTVLRAIAADVLRTVR
jgi:hypothetical protein